MAAADVNLLASLRKALQRSYDAPPDGFKTVRQYSRIFKLSESWTEKLLGLSVEQGSWEREKYLIETPAGPRRVNHYRKKRVKRAKKSSK